MCLSPIQSLVHMAFLMKSCKLECHQHLTGPQHVEACIGRFCDRFSRLTSLRSAGTGCHLRDEFAADSEVEDGLAELFYVLGRAVMRGRV